MLNPEIKKNIWADFSIVRLVIAPLAIAVFFALLYLWSQNVLEFVRVAHRWALILIGVIVYLGGNRIAAESIISEINARTWQSIRMTSLSPFQLTMGKLLGSTLFMWYSAIFPCVIYILTTFYLPEPIYELKFLALMLLIGLFGHSVTMLFSFVGIRRQRNVEKINSTIYFIIGTLISGVMLYHALSIKTMEDPFLKWYCFTFSYINYSIVTVVFFTVWAILGVYRNMKSELQYENGLSVWIAFLLFVMVYFSGLITYYNVFNFYETILIQLIFSLVVACFATYITVFSEPKNIQDFKKINTLIQSFKTTSFRKWLIQTQKKLPLWVCSFMFVLFIALIVIIFLNVSPKMKFMKETLLNFLFPINLVLFILRDIGIILAINFSKRINRSEFAALLLLGILYLLIPSLLNFVGLLSLCPIFLPFPKENFFLGTLPVMVQVGMVGYILLKEWKQNQ